MNSSQASQKVNIDKVEAPDNRGIDYERLICEFGTNRISEAQIGRIEKLTGKPAHFYLKRGIFFSHRDLDMILDNYEKNNPFYLYTGRGPSSQSMHLGHLVPFIFCKYLQDSFKVPIVIQITDDEKFFHKNLQLDEAMALGKENIKDIIACGFDPDNTFIFSNIEYIRNVTMLTNVVPFLVFKSRITSVPFVIIRGKYAFAAIQAAPSFSTSFPHLFGNGKAVPCLIPCAIDQDPYFRLTRDIAPRLNYIKPSLIHAKFMPALQGAKSKMSSSDELSSIYLSDSANAIAKKIRKYAFSGGRDTLEEQRKFGADLDVDVSISYLNYFMEDEERLDQIKNDYKAGLLLTGEVKNILISCIQEIVENHQRLKSQITDEDFKKFTHIP